MPVSWPAELQDYINEDEFGFKFGVQVLKTEMAQGPVKTRRISTRPINTMTVTITITGQEFIDYFEPFYNVYTNAGITPFEFTHPIRNETWEFKILGEPEITSIGGGNFRVSMVWEEQPQ